MVYAKAMLSQFDRSIAVTQQFATIALLAYRVVCDRLEPRQDVVSSDGIAQFSQLVGDAPHFFDHEVGGEVGVEHGQLVDSSRLGRDSGQDTVCGRDERIRPTRAHFDELLSFAFKRIAERLSFLGQSE